MEEEEKEQEHIAYYIKQCLHKGVFFNETGASWQIVNVKEEPTMLVLVQYQ